jgi:hypothetical protein
MPRYWESVAIGWRIFWRAVGGFLLTLTAANLVLLNLLPELTRSDPSLWALVVPLFAATTLTCLAVMPLVARALLKKRFGGFRLALVRDETRWSSSCALSAPRPPREEHRNRMTNEEGGNVMPATIYAWLAAGALAVAPIPDATAGAESADAPLHVVSGTLSKLDLSNGRGLLTTDLGRPVYFDVPKAYLFENVTVGARIALQLDEYGRAVKVMDTSIPDLIITPGERDKERSLVVGSEEPDGR